MRACDLVHGSCIGIRPLFHDIDSFLRASLERVVCSLVDRVVVELHYRWLDGSDDAGNPDAAIVVFDGCADGKIAVLLRGVAVGFAVAVGFRRSPLADASGWSRRLRGGFAAANACQVLQDMPVFQAVLL